MSQPYTPPPRLVEKAEAALAEAAPEELAEAARLYAAYGTVTEGRSAVSGAELPAFSDCRPLVKAGWLEVARAATRAR